MLLTLIKNPKLQVACTWSQVKDSKTKTERTVKKDRSKGLTVHDSYTKQDSCLRMLKQHLMVRNIFCVSYNFANINTRARISQTFYLNVVSKRRNLSPSHFVITFGLGWRAWCPIQAISSYRLALRTGHAGFDQKEELLVKAISSYRLALRIEHYLVKDEAHI